MSYSSILLTKQLDEATLKHALAAVFDVSPHDVTIVASLEEISSAAPIIARNEERIQVHLRFMVERLQRGPAPADPARAAARARLIEELGRYAERGAFPRNTERVGRMPRFMDDGGRACAVGHLMRASSRGELTEAIRRDHEYDTIAVIAAGPLGDEVQAWAAEQGFSLEELAEIQPSYGFEEIAKTQITGPDLQQFVTQEEYMIKHCLRGAFGTAMTSLKVTLSVWPGKGDAVERAIDLRLTPTLPKVEACIREPIDYFFRNVGLHYIVQSKLAVTVSYDHINTLTTSDKDRVADARKRAQEAVASKGRHLEQCISSEHPAIVAAKLSLFVQGNGEIGLTDVDTGSHPSILDCAASILGWPTGLVADRWTEPFELRLQIKRPPDPKPYRCKRDFNF